MTEPALLIERDGHIVTLTMNRPEFKNALNPEMICRLADAWEEANNDNDIRVVILTGAAGVFCAGADLDKLVTKMMQRTPAENEFEQRCLDNAGVIFQGLLRGYRMTKPLIAAVEGPCIAGGTEILQTTDIRVAGESATFGISEVRWGLFPQGGSTVRLHRQIPFTWAMELLLTGDHYPAADAFRMGLIGRVVPDGKALATARAIADRVASNGPVAVRKVKQSVLDTEFYPEQEALEIELKLGMEVFSTQDAREGPKAFKEKRTPQFKGS
jgi:enoyl-CoA hydratase